MPTLQMTGHRKNQEIEALRGVAVILAVISHVGNLLFWSDRIEKSQLAFWGGVDVFFAISGFVIASAFAQRIRYANEHGNFIREVGAFFVRRIFRIWPTAWLWILVMLFMSLHFNATGIFGSPEANIADLKSIVLNIANIHFAICLDQTDGARLCGSNGQYWSLSVEEQFYLMFPLLILLPRNWFFWLTALVVIGWQAALIAMDWQAPFLYLMRVDSIFLGVALAWFASCRAYKTLEPSYAKGLYAMPVLTFLLLVSRYHPGEYRPYTMMVSLIGAVMVWMASYDRSYLIGEGWARHLLAWIGARSFAIYLIHNPVFWFTRELWLRRMPTAHYDHHFTPLFVCTALPLILILAEVNYRIVEQPLRALGSRIAMKFSGDRISPPVGATFSRE
ncbi:acyltransferase family protein [Burkholderia ubonensis]|uniref:acyltransferase family protein n=1 Tax=Burkholderia ubonensis TaxID=101571 RepID=UPI0009B5844C|nr:acyltransferase [Burkholderia ubonensis]